MKPRPFLLERYFALHEFSARYLLSCSAMEALSMREVLEFADPQARAQWEELRLGYTESPGLPLLREEIARGHPGIAADDVLEVVPEEGIFLAMNALLEAGDHVIVTKPGYQSLYAVAESLSCEVTGWMPEETAGWRFDPAFVRSALRPNTRLVVCNFPHNPTGWLPSRTEWDELCAIVRERGIWLFSDEMYRGAELDPADRLASAPEVYERAVALSGLSKSYGMPGARVGWLVTRDRALRERLLGLKDYTTICGSAPSELLGLIALRSRERILTRTREILIRNREVLSQFLDLHRHLFTWTPPRAGPVGLVRLLREPSAQAFCDRAVEQAGIMIVPSSLFEYGDRHLRIGFGRANLPDVLEHLHAWIVAR